MRFDAVAAFGRATWMGLGANPLYENEWHCTVTLVDDDLVIGEEHCIDNNLSAANFAVRFRRQESSTVGTLEGGTIRYYQVAFSHWLFRSGDFFAARLVHPVPHIFPIPAAMHGVHSLSEPPFWQASWGKEGPTYNTGPRRELLLCANQLSGNEVTHQFSADWSPSAVGCGVNVSDSGSPQLIEKASGGRLFVVGVTSTTVRGVNLNALMDERELPVAHTRWALLDAAVEKVEVDPLYLAPGQSLTTRVHLLHAGAGKVPAGAKIIAKFFGATPGWTTGRLIFESTTDALFGPARVPLFKAYELDEGAPIGSYAVRWEFAGNMDFEQMFDGNNRAISSAVFVAPRYPSSRTHYFGFWKDSQHTSFPGKGLFALHRHSDGSIAYAAANEATGDVFADTRLEEAGVSEFGMLIPNAAVFEGQVAATTDPLQTETWE